MMMTPWSRLFLVGYACNSSRLMEVMMLLWRIMVLINESMVELDYIKNLLNYQQRSYGNWWWYSYTTITIWRWDQVIIFIFIFEGSNYFYSFVLCFVVSSNKLTRYFLQYKQYTAFSYIKMYKYIFGLKYKQQKKIKQSVDGSDSNFESNTSIWFNFFP